MCIYSDLEIFMVNRYNLRIASIIIENTGGRLKKIITDYCYYDDFEEDSLILIRKIYENCPLIEELCLILLPSKNHFTELEKLLKVCQNLKSLLIDMFDTNDRKTEEKFLKNGEELLKTLIRSAPSNLSEIRFLYGFTFSLEALEEFLEKWKGRALSILISSYIYENEDYIR
ncbi:hypothetical protein RclHR1_01390015 [Rhizophagus clarus]|uniref:F-box domain-containing protein n=1 Tax=Rhizophagus clarus TaxID=94130 RepID=A0A2Z6QD28_9GLOM|nr:hypothetical protein RclHR1_01390015 [Rhizophagus clarus]GET04896.1 hypothetical protein GLOIN_2v1879917 [Rhizophagus clarus]